MTSSSHTIHEPSGKDVPWNKLVATDRVSASSLARILTTLGTCSTRVAKRKLHQAKHSVDHFITPIDLGDKVQLPVVNVVSLIQYLVSQQGAFGKLLLEAALAASGQPLQLIVYYDDLIPGNVMAPDHQRKSTLVYVAIKQFNGYLCLQSSWLPIAVLRKHNMDKLSGGMNQFLCKLILELQRQLRHSFVVTMDKATLAVRIDSHFLYLADEAALKTLLGARGASGVKPCIKCKNVLYKRGAGQTHHPYFVVVSESQFQKFDIFSNSDLEIMAQSMIQAASSESPKDFELLQKRLGYNYVPTGTLLNVAVRNSLRVENFLYDSMHTYFSNGIVALEVNEFFRRLKRKTALSSNDFQRLVLCDWTQSGSRFGCKSERRLITREKFFKGTFYRGSAADLLRISPFVCFFLVTVLEGMDAVAEEVASLVCLMTTVNCMQRYKLGNEMNIQTLLQNQSAHMDRFLRCYGLESVIPKHHFQFHVSLQLLDHSCLLDCFTAERKHKVFKQSVAPLLQKLQNFEQCALVDLLSRQLETDQHETVKLDNKIGDYELDQCSAMELGVPYFRVSKSLSLGLNMIEVGHCWIFVSARKAVMVTAIVEVPDQYLIVCDAWELVRERMDFACSWWSPGLKSIILPAQDLVVTWLQFIVRLYVHFSYICC